MENLWLAFCSFTNFTVSKKNITILSVKHVMLGAIWYHSYSLKKCKKHPKGNVTFSNVAGFSFSLQLYLNTPPWAFFRFFKLYKWIAESVVYRQSILRSPNRIFDRCVVATKKVQSYVDFQVRSTFRQYFLKNAFNP